MARTLSRLYAGSLPLLAALGFLAGCSGSSKDVSNDPGDVSRIVYAVRQNTTVAADGTVSIDVAGGMGQVMDYGRYVPGGRLEVFDLRTSKVTGNIIEAYKTADVSS